MRPLLTLLAVVGVLTASLAGPAPAAEAASPTRVAGADRYATSVEISRQTPSPGDVVYLASGLKFADALSAGPTAAAEGAHLLLTRPEVVPAIVMERIGELTPSEIVLVGSAASVHDSVRAQLARTFPGTRIERIGGGDRVATSLLLLERLADTGPVTEIWIASGSNFPDALVAASVAGATSAGIVLDWHGTSAASARDWADRVAPYIDGMPLSIAGGYPSVSAADETLLLQRGGLDIVRYAGADRYDTARRINHAYPPAEDVTSMMLATGQTFPDALAGAVWAASSGMPLYLTPRLCHPEVTRWLGTEAQAMGAEQIIGLGSRASISDDALHLLGCPGYSALQQQMGERFGTFAAEIHDGVGDALLPLPAGASVGVALFGPQVWDPQRSSTITVTTVDAAGRAIGEPSVGDDTHVVRHLLAPVPGAATPTHLRVEATEDWTLTIRDVRSLGELEPVGGGLDNGIWLYDGEGELRNGHFPESGFSIERIGGTVDDLQRTFEVPWTAGGTMAVELGPGPSIISVRTSGAWSLLLP